MKQRRKERTRGLRSDPELLRDVVQGVHQDLFRDRVGRALVRTAELGIANDEIAHLIRSRVHRHAVQRAMGQIPPLREPDLRTGELEPGTSLGGQRIRFPVRALAAGWLVVANTGSGKTNLLAHLLPQLASTGVRVWVTDMYKQQHRLMRDRFVALGANLMILRPEDSAFNLLQASPNQPGPHLTLTCDLLVRLLNLPPRARTILRQTVYELYERFGTWRGRTEEWPTLFDLYEAIRTATGLHPMSKEAILDRLAALLVALGSRAAYRRAWTHQDLAGHNVVFEMTGASELVKHTQLLPTIFGQLLHRLSRGVVNRPMNLFIMLDDAQRFLEDSAHLGQGEIPPFLEAAGVVRGAGISLGVAVQSMNGVPAGLPENLATKTVGRLGSEADRRMYRELGLDQEQRTWASLSLEPGMFLTQLATGRWRHPFAIRTPLVQHPCRVSETEIQDSLAPLRDIPVRFAEEFRTWTPYGPTAEAGTASETPTSPPELDLLQRRLLAAVADDPGQPSRVYAKRLKTNGARIKEARLALEALGYVRSHSLATGKRGGRAIVLEPLERAAAILAEEA